MNEKPFKIFVVEDDEWYNRLLVHNLSLNPDYDIESFTNGKDCLSNLNKTPDVVTLDYRLPAVITLLVKIIYKMPSAIFMALSVTFQKYQL